MGVRSSQEREQRIPLPVIDTGRCTGCGRCIAVCGPHVLSFETVRWKKSVQLHDVAGCTGCSLCAARCPFDAITMQRFARSANPLLPR